MKAAMRVMNADRVAVELRHIGERVVSTARGAMHRSGERILANAKLNAPVDKFNLEEAIQIVSSRGVRGRLQIDIDVVDSIHGVNVAQYALIIHENYESIATSDAPDAREGTKQKQAANPGRYVGGKFLERAADEERRKLQPHLVEAVTKAIQGGM